MGEIHLIKNDPGLPQIKPLERGSDKYRSGNWDISRTSADGLIGGKIYFHRAQVAPSFFGGRIIATDEIKEGEWAGRIVFIFEFEEACKNVTTPQVGWSQEMKVIP